MHGIFPVSFPLKLRAGKGAACHGLTCGRSRGCAGGNREHMWPQPKLCWRQPRAHVATAEAMLEATKSTCGVPVVT